MKSLHKDNQRTWVQETDDYIEKDRSSESQEPQERSWLRQILEPLVIAVMILCVTLSLDELIWMIAPEAQHNLFIISPVVGAFVGYRSWIVTQRKLLDGTDRLRKYIVELAVMFLLIKVVSLLDLTVPALLGTFQMWASKPFSFFDSETAIAFFLSVGTWLMGILTARDLTAIFDPRMYAGELGPMQRLFRRFLAGGIVLLFASAMGRVRLEDIVLQQYDQIGGTKLNILLYFILGLVMLGQMRFARMESLWRLQDVTIASVLKTRWLRYTLLLITVISLVALLLPTGYALGIMDIIRWIFAIISYIITLLYLLIVTPLLWLFSLFQGEDVAESAPMGPMPQLETPPPQQTSGSPAWLQVVQSVIFWLIGILLLIYIIRSYLRDHPDLLRSVRKLKLAQILGNAWQAFTKWWRKTFRRLRMKRGQTVSPILGESKYRIAAPTGVQNNLQGRNAIMKAYYRTLDRARNSGVARHPAQTPDEYQPKLETGSNEPESAGILTRLFLKAHYSLSAVTDEDVRTSQANAKIVQNGLRQHKRNSDKTNTP